MTQKYQVKVSMKQAAIVETGIVLKQGDFGMQIEIEVLDFDVTGTTPQIVFRKPMGAVESTTISVSNNKYTYTFAGTELDTPGKVFCDLKLKNSTTQRISTASFMFRVIADTMDGLNEQASSYSDTIAQIVGGFDGDISELHEEIDDFAGVGKNIFGLAEKTGTKTDGITATWDGNKIVINGTGNQANFRIPLNEKYIENGETYTLSLNNISGTKSGALSFQIQNCADTPPNYPSWGTKIDVPNNATSASGVLSKTAGIYTLNISAWTGATFSDYTIYFQLEKSSTKTDYEKPINIVKNSLYLKDSEINALIAAAEADAEEYTDEAIDLYLGKTKNVFYPKTATGSETHADFTVSWDGNKLVLDGTASSYFSLRIPLDDSVIEKGETYTFSLNNITGTRSGVTNYEIQSNQATGSYAKVATLIEGIAINTSTLYKSGTMTKTDDQIYTLFIDGYSGANYDNFTIYLQLEKGSSKTDYEKPSNIVKDSPYLKDSEINALIATAKQETKTEVLATTNTLIATAKSEAMQYTDDTESVYFGKNKNVFDPKAKTGSKTAAEFTVAWDGNKLVLNGTATSFFEIRIPLNDKVIENGQTYTLSLNNITGTRSGVTSYEIQSNQATGSYAKVATLIEGIAINASTLYKSGTLTKTSDQIYTLAITGYSGAAYTNYTIYLQLEKGSSKTDYTAPKNTIKNSDYLPEEEIDKKIQDATSDDSPVRFIVMSDIHMGDASCEDLINITPAERAEILINALNDEIKNKQIDFILCLGDIAHVSYMTNFNYWTKNVAPYINAPIYSLPGNHDGFTETEWENHTNDKRQYVIETDRFYIFCIDSYQSEYQSGDPSYCTNIIDSQFRALYAKYTDKPVIVAMHYWDYLTQDANPGMSAQNYFAQFDRVILLLTGHGHYWATTYLTNAGIYQLAIGCFTCSHLQEYYENISETGDTSCLWGFNIIETYNNKLRSYRVQPAVDYTVYNMPYTISMEQDLYDFPAKPIADKVVIKDKTNFYIHNKLKLLEDRVAALES